MGKIVQMGRADGGGSHRATAEEGNKPTLDVVVAADATADDPGEPVRVDTGSLAGLRAIASLQIMMGHYLYFGGVPVELMGGAAVTMFFVLSGFVMTLARGSEPVAAPICDGRRKRRGAEPFPGKAFIWNRFVRVAPMYWITNTVCLPLGYYINAEGSLMKLAVSSLTSAFVAGSWMSITPPNGLTWTISTLMGFWLLSPIVIPLAQRVPARHRWYWIWGMYFIQCAFYAIVFAEVSDVVDAYWWARAWPPIRLPVYLMGVLAGLHVVDPPALHPDEDDAERPSVVSNAASRKRISRDSGASLPTKKSSRVLADVYAVGYVVVVAVAAVGSSGLVMSENAIQDTIIADNDGEISAEQIVSVSTDGDTSRFLARCFMEMVMPIFFLGWILSLAGRPPVVSSTGASAESFVGRFFRGRAMQFLGKISMSLYMVHLIIPQYVLVITAMTAETRANPTPEALLEIYNAGGWPLWCTPLFVLSSLGLAYLCWRFIEVPLGRRFRRSVETDAAGPAGRGSSTVVTVVTSVAAKPRAKSEAAEDVIGSSPHLPGAQLA